MISLRSVLTPLNLTSVRELENVTHSADFAQIPDWQPPSFDPTLVVQRET